MKFTLATIAIAAIGVSAVESNGIFTHASFRQATSARKFDTLTLGDYLLPRMSDACKAVFSPAVAAHLVMAPIAGQPTTAASLDARCTPALMQDFQTKWAATEAVCTKDELGNLISLGSTTEGVCLKVDGEYCGLNSEYVDTAANAYFENNARCCDGDFGPFGDDSTITNVGRKWGCYDCNCRDYSNAAVHATADCESGRDLRSQLGKICGNQCLEELVKLNFMDSGDVDPDVAEFMVNLYCLKDSNDKICGMDRDKKDCTSSCARDHMSTLNAAVRKDKDLYCKPAPVAPVANATVMSSPDVITLMDKVWEMFDPFCEDDAKNAQELALLELKCMTNEDGAFCQDAFPKYPDVCPKKPCDPTEPKTCSAACAAEMQSIADSSKCCVSEQKLFALKHNMPRCELDVYDACSTTFKFPVDGSNRCDKAFSKITPPTPSPTADGFISASTQLQASLCSLLLAFAASLTLRV